jgi:arylsulfatase A-like enzyme/Tfp pilus assembly protein PilF
MCRIKRVSIIVLSAFLLSMPPKPHSEPKNSSDFNILLITLDTTRADHLGCYGYEKTKTPNLDTLARNGVRFANAYSQVPLTLPSHCSIMTGTYPLYHQVHNNGFYYLGPENLTLANLLKKSGFKTAAFVSSFTLDSRFGIAQGFDLYDDKFQDEEILKNFRSERKADKLFASFSPWFDENFNQKFFCWVHFYDPHLPYDPPSPFKEEFDDKPYDGEIAFVDFVLGKILDKFREKNILDKTLLIVAGDHGEALGERREVDHGLFLYDNTLKVPLVFYAEKELPGGVVVSSRVRLIDILPTILDLLRISIPKEVQGTSLLPYITGQKKDDLPSYIETYFPRENFGWSGLQGLIDSEWKFIRAPRPELYYLKNDPREESNIFQKERAISRAEAEKLGDLIKKFSKGMEATRRTLTPEEEEKLRSLGYIGGGHAEDLLKKSLPDPKDKIEDYILYFRGNLLETEGNFEKASECYREVLRLNPDVPWNYVNLGFLYMKMNRTKQAIELLEKVQTRFPDSVVILSRLMSFYLKAERWEDALSKGQVILKINPHFFDALFLSGSANAKIGKWKEALNYYQKALEIEPENKTLQHRYAYTLAALGRYEEALEAYTQLKKNYPDDYTIDLDLSLVYDSVGEREKAREILKQAADRHPSPDTYYAYAMFLEKVGNLKEAVHYLKLYLETTPEIDTPRKNKAQKALAQWEKRLKTQ